jgi:hypothetical protein
VKTCGCRCRVGDLGSVVEVLLSVLDCSPGAQLAEALDVGIDKMDWLETSWSQALLLIQDKLFMRQSSDEAI